MPGGDDASRDNAHRAVGHYVVEFSRLMATMRLGLERYLSIEGSRAVPALALGAALPEQLTQSFFAICEHVADLDKGEEKVAIRLRVEVLDEIKRRNDFAHGDWLLGNMREVFDEPILVRVKPGRRKGPVQNRPVSIAEIDAAADEVWVLSQKVTEFGSICLGTFPVGIGKDGIPFKVRQAFRVEGKKVLRINPVAINWF